MTRTGIKLDLDVGGVVSNARQASEAISSIDKAMGKVEETEPDVYGKLAYQKTRIQSHNARLNNDLRAFGIDPSRQGTGSPAFAKMDPEQNQRFKDLTEAIKKLYAHYKDQTDNGRFDEGEGTLTHIDKLEGERHTLMKEANASETKTHDAMKALVFGQIANSINDGFKIWANSLDRSGIVSAYGSGDILGGRIAEKQRTADIFGGGAQVALGTGGAAATALGHPEIGVALNALGQLVNNLAHAPINQEKTDAAYAGLWQQRSADAMNLAALMGDPSKVRNAFNIAADAAMEFCYTAEEGMDAMKQAAMQGLSGEDARKAASQVFDYERRTGADRGTLSSASLMAARYKMGNVLQMGWAGLQASSMNKGQYGEFLQAMQKVMENGISKGFIKSADQVATSFTYLAQLTNNSPLWQGENGARRLMDMNAGMESATGLKSTSDIIAYQAARNLTGGGSYIDAMMKLEEGLTPEFFNEYMKLTKTAEGGSKEGIIERMRQTFGLKYKSAYELYEGWDPSMDSASVKALVDRYNTPPPKASSAELEWAQLTAQTANIHVQTGQFKFDEMIPKLREERDKAKDELINAILGGKRNQPTDFGKMTPNERNEWGLRGYGEFQSTLGSYFSPGNWWNPFKSSDEKNDSSAMEAIKRTVGNAFLSDDAGEKEQAAKVANLLNSIKPEIRKEWDANNTLNKFAGSDMGGLLDAVRQLHSDMLELTYATKENATLTISYE
jgi:hypothetical protein